MIEISSENDDYYINGYISYPEVTRSTRSEITTLVNGRVIKNNKLNKAIIDKIKDGEKKYTAEFENTAFEDIPKP